MIHGWLNGAVLDQGSFTTLLPDGGGLSLPRECYVDIVLYGQGTIAVREWGEALGDWDSPGDPDHIPVCIQEAIAVLVPWPILFGPLAIRDVAAVGTKNKSGRQSVSEVAHADNFSGAIGIAKPASSVNYIWDKRLSV